MQVEQKLPKLAPCGVPANHNSFKDNVCNVSVLSSETLAGNTNLVIVEQLLIENSYSYCLLGITATMVVTRR